MGICHRWSPAEAPTPLSLMSVDTDGQEGCHSGVCGAQHPSCTLKRMIENCQTQTTELWHFPCKRLWGLLLFFKFLIKFIGVTLVNKIIQFSGMQFCDTSSVHGIACWENGRATGGRTKRNYRLPPPAKLNAEWTKDLQPLPGPRSL